MSVYGVIVSSPKVNLADNTKWTTNAIEIPSNYADEIVDNWEPAEDQSQTGMCVAFSSSEIRRWWLEKLGLDAPMLSAAYIYARGHQFFGSQGEGMQPVSACEALKVYGTCLWTSDPLNPSNEDVSQSITASPSSLDAEAAAFKITNYGPVDVSNIKAMQLAIMHAPIMIAIPVPITGGIENPVADGEGDFNVLWPPGNNVQIIGGHALMIYGWKTDVSGHIWWKLRNSWGKSWANNGSAWLDSLHPIQEAWSITCDPKAIVNIVISIGSNVYSVNGKQMTMDTEPVINSDNRTMVPLRFIAEGLGYTVKPIFNPNGTTKSIIITDQ